MRRQFESITITGQRGGAGVSTSMTVSGPKADVEAWWTEYCIDYHPAGYGTMRRLVKEEGNTVTYHVWRSHTCD